MGNNAAKKLMMSVNRSIMANAVLTLLFIFYVLQHYLQM